MSARDGQESLQALLASALSCSRRTEAVTTTRTSEGSRESQTGAAGKGLHHCKTTVTELAGFVSLALDFLSSCVCHRTAQAIFPFPGAQPVEMNNLHP